MGVAGGQLTRANRVGRGQARRGGGEVRVDRVHRGPADPARRGGIARASRRDDPGWYQTRDGTDAG